MAGYFPRHLFLRVMRQQFLRTVLPSRGVYCAVAITPNREVYQHFFDSIEELEDLLSENDGVNVYFTPNTFSGYSRLADFAAWGHSFFVDLDVGAGKGYPSKQAAIDALQQFVKESTLPPPIIVDSGTGIHGYWPFDTDVAIAEWRAYAKIFKQYCITHGLHIDATVTADVSRIMRCPDSFNYKTEPPTPSKILTTEFINYDFEEFKSFLGPAPLNGHDLLESLPKGLDDETRKLLKVDNYETIFADLVIKSLGVGNSPGCAQIAYIINNSKTLPYPLWMAGLSVAARCDDADSAIHLMSEDYDGYSREATEFKARETLKASGPHLCATFDQENPGLCPTCPHWGKLSPQSPIALGRKLRVTPTGTDLVVQDGVPIFPDSLKPFVRGKHGGIYYLPPRTPDDEADKLPVLIVPYDLYPVKRIYSQNEGECLQMVYVTPHDGRREFLVNIQDTYSVEKLSAAVMRYGVTTRPHNIKHLMNYLIQWIEHMFGIKKAEDMRMQMGFTEHYEAFVIGNREFRSDGTEFPAPSSPYVRSVAKLMTPAGEYKTWRTAADYLNAPGMELHAFGMMCGFGSPLMWMTSTSGVCVSYYGTTGAAKTGALYGALSLFGKPKELSVFEATDNGGIQRMLGLHNILLGRDEASNMDPIALSNLIHNISSGKSKIRLQSSVNAERDHELSASLIAFFTSNHALQEKLQIKKASPEGEMARLIEFFLEEKPALIANNPALAKQIFDTFRECYGHAGPMFIKHIYKVGFTEIRERIKKWSTRFLLTFGTNSAYRYYENLIATTFTAAELANEAGIINFDLERIYDVVMVNVCSIKDNVKLNDLDYGAVVAEYIHKNVQNFLFLDGDRVVGEPRGDLKGRIEIHNQIQYVSKKEFKKYLAELQVSPKEFEHSAKKGNLLIKDIKQRLSNGWRAGIGTPPIQVYGFKADVENIVNEIKNGPIG